MTSRQGKSTASVPHVHPSDEIGGIGSRWRKYLSRFNNLLIAMAVTEPDRKRALLLHYAGEETIDIFGTLPNTGDVNNYTQAVDALTAYFDPKQNTEFEVFKFGQTAQQPQESIDSFHTRLRQIAANCDFHSIDREIKTQIIKKCTSTRLRRRALREPNLDLSQLLQMARAMEISEKQASGMEENSVVNRVTNDDYKHKFKPKRKTTPKKTTTAQK